MAKNTTKTTSSSRKAPVSAEQRQAVEAQRHAPVSLPSGGSYDMQTLTKGLNAAVDSNGENRDAEIGKALAAADNGGSTNTAAPNALPDHKVMRVDTQLSAGTIVGEGKDAEAIGSQTVTEFRQVYDPSTAKGDTAPQGIPVSDMDADAGSRSSIVGMTDVGAGSVKAPAAAPAPGSTDVGPKDGETGESGTTSNADATEAAILSGQSSDGDSN